MKFPNKVLLIRFSSIGDILLTTPVIRCIKKYSPDTEVHFLTKAAYHGLLEHNPYLTKIHLLQSDWKQNIRSLKAEKFDLIIDLHHNLRTFRLKSALKIPSRSFNKLNFEKWLKVRFKRYALPKMHIVERYMHTLVDWDIKTDLLGLDCFIGENAVVDVKAESDFEENGYVAWAIGGQHTTKKLPLEKMSELLNYLQFPLVILGGEEDQMIGEKIREFFPEKVYNAAGKYSIMQSCDWVRKSRGVISHDTGMMHVAAAFSKPLISIWGNTIPEFGMYPYKPQDKTELDLIAEVKDLPCRPCSKIGFDRCPKGHFKCMRQQDMKKIANRLEKW